MSLVRVDVSGRTSAAPAQVFALARDSASYPDWAMISSFELVRPGRLDQDDVGQVRIFRTGPLKLVEEVVELIPLRRVGYIVHSGLPFRDYRANIDLTPLADGRTEIHWRATFHPKIPGTGWLCRAFMRSVFARMVPDLARAAEAAQASAAPVPVTDDRPAPAEDTTSPRTVRDA
jgi:Polyketide cyclase / dehydrase and lipid transport